MLCKGCGSGTNPQTQDVVVYIAKPAPIAENRQSCTIFSAGEEQDFHRKVPPLHRSWCEKIFACLRRPYRA
jgi:hypothetical protein